MSITMFLVWLTMFGSTMFWFMDACDIPFMVIFDTEIPLNGGFWVIYALMYVVTMSTVIELNKEFNK